MAALTKDVIPFSLPLIPDWEGSNEHNDSGTGESETLSFPFMNQLYRTALILTGSPRLAMNLLQATCLQARDGHHHFHNDDDFGVWMFRILFDAFGSNRHMVDPRQGDSSQPN